MYLEWQLVFRSFLLQLQDIKLSFPVGNPAQNETTCLPWLVRRNLDVRAVHDPGICYMTSNTPLSLLLGLDGQSERPGPTNRLAMSSTSTSIIKLSHTLNT